MNKFFAIIVSTVLALSFFSSPALARNEVVNAWFHDCTALDNTYSGVGDANWRCVVPDGSNRIMHFEKCWTGDQGIACKYEVIVSDHGGNNVEVTSNNNVSVDVEVNTGNTGGGDWSGIFGGYDMVNGVPHAWVMVNGVKQTNAYSVCDENHVGEHGRGLYCK